MNKGIEANDSTACAWVMRAVAYVGVMHHACEDEVTRKPKSSIVEKSIYTLLKVCSNQSATASISISSFLIIRAINST